MEVQKQIAPWHDRLHPERAALEHALQLAERGIPSFPCRVCADRCYGRLGCGICKTPTKAGGFHNATTDPDALKTLWRDHPGGLVGVPTGAPSGLSVLDLDTGKHPEARDWLGANKARIPETR